MSPPLVSVIIPTYGDERFLPVAIHSVNAQTYENIEIILVDSSDSTELQSIAHEYENITYYFQKPRGVSAARNKGIDEATGDIIAFLDADDYWDSGKLEAQLKVYENGADIVYTDACILNNATSYIEKAPTIDDPDTHYKKYFLSGGVKLSSVIVDKTCLETHRFEEQLTRSEDPHLWTRLFKKYRPGYVDQPLVYKRNRADSLSSDPHQSFKYRRKAAIDLACRIDDLEELLVERLTEDKYNYGKKLAQRGELELAREMLLDSLTTGVISRSFVILAITYLPFKRTEALTLLETIYRKYAQ